MSLTNEEASIILGMVARGDSKHDIAAWFGVNQARVKEVEDGAHGNLVAAPLDKLFPKGAPGPRARRLRKVVEKAAQLLESGDNAAALNALKEAATKYDKAQ